MLRLLLLASSVSFALAAWAAPFPNADPAKGQQLASRSCVECHRSKFGGDGTKIYIRGDRRVKSAKQLLQQVTFCSQAANTDWSQQEIADVAAYLNQTFYQFH